MVKESEEPKVYDDDDNKSHSILTQHDKSETQQCLRMTHVKKQYVIQTTSTTDNTSTFFFQAFESWSTGVVSSHSSLEEDVYEENKSWWSCS